MIGNFYNDGRDQLTICKALPELFKKYPYLHFVFVGGRSPRFPQYYDNCYNYCKENSILTKTHFVGNRSDINNILHSLDVYVYSSNHDSFGISVIEAMIVGLHIIINDLSSLLEITNEGKCAQVFKTKDEKSLFAAISQILDCVKERENISKAGQKWALDNFTIDKYIKNLQLLYKSLL